MQSVAASAVTNQVGRHESTARDYVELLAYASLVLLLWSAPFEAARPVIRLPMQSVSNLELVVLVALAASAAAFAVTPRRAVWRGTLLAPWLAFCAVAITASFVAAEQRGNALHMSMRLLMSGGVYAAAVVTFDRGSRVARAMAWIVITGILVSVAAVLEYLEVPAVLAALTTFRPAVALVGAQVRAAGPLQYPTIASMYLEVCFACGLGLLARALIDARRQTAATLVVALAVIGEGIVVTFTRSGLITATLSIVIVAGLTASRLGVRRTVPFLLVALAGAAEVAVSRSNEVIGARLASEGQEGWYRATIEAPASISLAPGQAISVPIRLRNDGQITWDPDAPRPFRVSYHWLEAGSPRVVEWEGVRTLLPQSVAPGGTLALGVSVRAPAAAGKYRLIWDVEQTERLWFSTEPDAALAETVAVVEGVAVGANRRTGPLFMPARAVRPGRRVLWGAAARMLADRPWTGIGPDNYRLLYGRYASLARADPRVHSNNTYIELIVGTGVMGAIALAWVGRRLAGVVSRACRSGDPLAAGLVAAAAAIAVHGLTDSFLGFTPTYVVGAVAMGLLTLAAGPERIHADRV
jgi:hypothetical protein